MSTTAFTLNLTDSNVCLPAGHGLSLKDAGGVVLTSLKGRLWLTMEGERRDIDLYPGATYTIERDGLTLVNALEPSVIQVRMPHARRAVWRYWIDSLWAWLVRAGELRAHARMARGNYRF